VNSLTESEGCALLHARFTDAGYHIVANFQFKEGDIEVDLDGWDASARVGYEYVTQEASDRLQFTPTALASFEARMAKDELFVLLVDETEAVTPDALDAFATSFLAEVAKRKQKL
jgi:hypothetical protein